MTEDIDYCPSRSIADLPITDPAHLPCPDMAGMENPDPKKRERSLCFLDELREKHGIQKRKATKHNPSYSKYVCTEYGCIEPWGAVNNAVV